MPLRVCVCAPENQIENDIFSSVEKNRNFIVSTKCNCMERVTYGEKYIIRSLVSYKYVYCWNVFAVIYRRCRILFEHCILNLFDLFFYYSLLSAITIMKCVFISSPYHFSFRNTKRCFYSQGDERAALITIHITTNCTSGFINFRCFCLLSGIVIV